MLKSTMYLYLLRMFYFQLEKNLVYGNAKFLKSLYLATDRLFPKKSHI